MSGGAKGEDIRAQAQPIIDLAFQDRLAVLGAIALAMDDMSTAHPQPGAFAQEFLAEPRGKDSGQTMEVQYHFPGNGTTLQFGQNPLLYAGFGVE